jgi:predicted porin
MNKKLLAVAVVGALASPAAFAQSTTLYGIIDVGYQNANNYGGGTLADRNHNFVEQGQHSPSRFGVRGSEDLAGGMYAMYGFESNLPVDNGGLLDTNRLGFVGLGSKAWGELTLGRQYTHVFHTFAVGSSHAYGTFASGYAWSGIQSRASNSIKYSSPVFSGFSVGAIWSPSGQGNDEPGKVGTDASTKQNYWDAALRWTPGPFGAAIAHGRNTQQNAVTTTAESKLTTLSGNFDNKAFGVYANWNKHSNDTPAGQTHDWKIWSVSGVARFAGVHELYAMYGRAKDNVSTAAGTPLAKTWGIVYENVLSKRTHAYLGYGKTKNEGGARLAPLAFAAAPATQINITGDFNATNVAPNSSPRGIQLGLVHTF